MDIAQLKRIADAMEEILRLVKKDMANIQKSVAEESEKKMTKPTLIINMLSGIVDSVDGLPEGWTYQVVEHGND